MNNSDPPTSNLVIVERLAGAIRDALGDENDAGPGAGESEPTHSLHRAFAAVVETIVAWVAEDASATPASVSLTLRLAIEQRRTTETRSDEFIRALIKEEPSRPDDWLVFLLLTVRAPIEPLAQNNHDAF